MESPPSPAARAAGAVLLTLAAAQFLMALDGSVMNVSIATVAKDVGTTVTGIQTAITSDGGHTPDPRAPLARHDVLHEAHRGRRIDLRRDQDEAR